MVEEERFVYECGFPTSFSRHRDLSHESLSSDAILSVKVEDVEDRARPGPRDSRNGGAIAVGLMGIYVYALLVCVP